MAFCVVLFDETRYHGVVQKTAISSPVEVGGRAEVFFPLRKQPFAGDVKWTCDSRGEAEAIATSLQQKYDAVRSHGSANSGSDTSTSSNSNSVTTSASESRYVTTDVFNDMMNRALSIFARQEEHLQTLVRLQQNRGSKSAVRTEEPLGQEDESGIPSWEFISKGRADELKEECGGNHKIFARKVSFVIFDESEQKLKLSSRNPRKVSELRKIIRFKFCADNPAVEEVIWSNCRAAVNNTIYNEAKRKKRHPTVSGADSGSPNRGGHFPSMNDTVTYDLIELPPKRSNTRASLKMEPESEFADM